MPTYKNSKSKSKNGRRRRKQTNRKLRRGRKSRKSRKSRKVMVGGHVSEEDTVYAKKVIREANAAAEAAFGGSFTELTSARAAAAAAGSEVTMEEKAAARAAAKKVKAADEAAEKIYNECYSDELDNIYYVMFKEERPMDGVQRWEIITALVNGEKF